MGKYFVSTVWKTKYSCFQKFSVWYRKNHKAIIKHTYMKINVHIFVMNSLSNQDTVHTLKNIYVLF